jgi:hypothetical protein
MVEMGNHWGREKGMGRERGGEGQFTSNLGPEWTGSHHTQRRDSK